MLEKSFGMFFFLKQPKYSSGDERYVYLRVTIDGLSKEVSTKRMWPVSRWDQSVGKAKGTKEDAASLNAFLDVLRSKVYAIKSKLLSDEKSITAQCIKDVLTGKGEQRRMLLETFAHHNDEIFNLVGKGYAYKTYQKYQTTYRHTQAFVKWKYQTVDLELKTVDYAFAKDFSTWLKTVKNCNHNSTLKYLTTLKSMLLECKRKKWLKENPFEELVMSYEEVEIIPLYANELMAIKNKCYAVDRLNLVKDIFIFSCYTGLAYVDVCNLKRSQMVIGVDGEQWIITKRQKTNTPQRIPLLPQAIEIIEKYRQHERCVNQDSLLPIFSNQKMNAYLKEIADTCGIQKRLTFHLARHTFATTVTLSNGVPIETVSKMLGHKSLKQTLHYAKVIDLKVSQDMAILKEKLMGAGG